MTAGSAPAPTPDHSRTPTGAHLARAREELRQHTQPPPRPVLVLSGWRAPALASWLLARTLRDLLGPGARVIGLGHARCSTFDAMARSVRERISREVGPTTTLDVVGVSMGGILARYCAAPHARAPLEPIRIGRLFTLASPHRGARLARIIALDSAARDMRPGSDFLQKLDQTPLPPLTPYAHLHDTWVGASNTAPPGMHPIWLQGSRPLSHHRIATNRVILLDIARRIKGLPPLLPDALASPPPHD